MEQFYDKNYFQYEMLRLADYSKQRVWKILFDKDMDIIYLFLARVNVIKANRLYDYDEMFPKQKDTMFKKYEQEMDALQVYSNSDVELKLYLQIWNVDDRKLLDKHHKKHPLFEKRTLEIKEKVSFSMNLFSMMRDLENKYQYHA